MAARAKAGIIERPTVILRTILQRFSELQIRDVPAGILLAFSDASPSGCRTRMIHTKRNEIYAYIHTAFQCQTYILFDVLDVPMGGRWLGSSQRSNTAQ